MKVKVKLYLVKAARGYSTTTWTLQKILEGKLMHEEKDNKHNQETAGNTNKKVNKKFLKAIKSGRWQGALHTSQ